MKLKAMIGVAAFAALLTGCSAPYSCQMGYQCVGLDEAYDAALSDGGTSQSVIAPMYRQKVQQQPLKASASRGQDYPKTAEWNPYGGGKLTDKPVYLPPKPMRIWIAPWVEKSQSAPAESYLLGGQFMYVTIGGKWQMGDLGKAGRAGELMLSPFTPVPKNKKRVDPNEKLINTKSLEAK